MTVSLDPQLLAAIQIIGAVLIIWPLAPHIFRFGQWLRRKVDGER